MRLKNTANFTDYLFQAFFTYSIMIVISIIAILFEIKNKTISFMRSIDILSDSFFPTTITFLVCLLVIKDFYFKHRLRYNLIILIIIMLTANYIAYISIKDIPVPGITDDIVRIILFLINLAAIGFSFRLIKKPFFTVESTCCDGEITSNSKGGKIR